MGFSPYWDYKPGNGADPRITVIPDIPVIPGIQGIYNSDKILILKTKDKIHLKCDNIDGSGKNGIQEPILFSFVLNKNQGTKFFRNHKQFII